VFAGSEGTMDQPVTSPYPRRQWPLCQSCGSKETIQLGESPKDDRLSCLACGYKWTDAHSAPNERSPGPAVTLALVAPVARDDAAATARDHGAATGTRSALFERARQAYILS
jgi:hypothetical protein